jgi:ADP-ribose pyrophosphatase YjhB (NUDIX family)
MMRSVFMRARGLIRFPDVSFDDDPGAWKVLTSEYLSRELWYTVRVDRVQLPSGTVIPSTGSTSTPPWVSVVAVTADDRVVLIRQYRHGIGAVHFEIPAGTTDPEDASLEAGARRELLEETGYGGGTWSLLTTLSANPALQNNLSYTFLAEGVTAGTATPDASEDIRVHLVRSRTSNSWSRAAASCRRCTSLRCSSSCSGAVASRK